MVFPARFRRRSLADHTAQGAQSLPGGHGHSPAATVTAGRPALQPGVTRTVGSGEAAKPDPPRNRTHATGSPRRTLGVTCTLRLRPPSSRVPRPACIVTPEQNRTSRNPRPSSDFVSRKPGFHIQALDRIQGTARGTSGPRPSAAAGGRRPPLYEARSLGTQARGRRSRFWTLAVCVVPCTVPGGGE